MTQKFVKITVSFFLSAYSFAFSDNIGGRICSLI